MAAPPSNPTVRSFRSIIGVPPSEPTTKDSVLIIVDAQNEYRSGALTIKDVETSAAGIKVMLDKYRKAGGDVIHVLHKTPEGAPIFTPNTPLAEEFEELKPTDGEKVIHKPAPSSFTGTDLHEYLQKLGKNKIVLVGYMAHVCISGTARAGFELGYEVTVVSDAIGDRDVPGASAEVLVATVLAELGDSVATVHSSTTIE